MHPVLLEAQMEVSVEFEEGLKIVSGTISGDLTKEIAADYFTQVGRVVSERNCHRVLTDVRQAYLRATEEDMRSLSQELAQIGLKSSCKRAIVLKDDVSGYKRWENHCFTAGYKNVRLFVDCDLAKEWLTEH